MKSSSQMKAVLFPPCSYLKKRFVCVKGGLYRTLALSVVAPSLASGRFARWPGGACAGRVSGQM